MPHRLQNRMLLVASYVFYGYWDYRFLSLILFSTIVDYFVAKRMFVAQTREHRRSLLIISLVVNLGLLGFFKYFGFFSQEFQGLLELVGLTVSLPALNIILPVGISFYTFQTLSYTIDVYRGDNKPADNFLDFALYVSLFPQLVAGPIERSTHLLPQILKPRPRSNSDFTEGLYHVLTGLFKKVVIADNMAPIVNTVFSTSPADLTGPEVMLGIYAFAFQIYGDFSGYSSIAKGVAKWLGFDLMWNFKNPYFAISPSDFWRRWHISLSTWLRDYLYISLGGNRGKPFFVYRNLMLTMLLGGLWHGAAWTFIVWGFYHGSLLIGYRLLELKGFIQTKSVNMSKATHIFRMVLFFHLICLSWLLFRAESMEQVMLMTAKLFTDFRVTELTLYGLSMMFFFAGPMLALEIWTEKSKDLLILLRVKRRVRAIAYIYMIGMIWVFPPLIHQDFIYFQF